MGRHVRRLSSWSHASPPSPDTALLTHPLPPTCHASPQSISGCTHHLHTSSLAHEQTTTLYPVTRPSHTASLNLMNLIITARFCGEMQAWRFDKRFLGGDLCFGHHLPSTVMTPAPGRAVFSFHIVCSGGSSLQDVPLRSEEHTSNSSHSS